MNVLPFTVKCAGCRKWIHGQVHSSPGEPTRVITPDTARAYYNIDVHHEGKGLLMVFYCESCHNKPKGQP